MHTVRGRVGAVFFVVIWILTCVSPTANAAEPPDTVWLCKPDRVPNPCGGSQDTTVVDVSGSSRIEHIDSPVEPSVDCFYVYPTVSTQLTMNATMTAELEQNFIAEDQASAFSRSCRVYAPVYRQATFVGIVQAVATHDNAPLELAYSDVERAWDDYMAHYNHGRGVVIIGHSQGSIILRALIRNRIENDPVASQRMISAILLGGNVLVKSGKDIGGDFSATPACRSFTQIHCVVAYSAYNTPPPSISIFGSSTSLQNDVTLPGLPSGPGYQVLCTNPGALASTDPAPIHPVVRSGVAGAFVSPVAAIASTPFTEPPAGFTGQCIEQNGVRVLFVRGGPGNSVPQLDTPGGLHLLDMNVALRDLTDLVAVQAHAYLQ